MIPKHQIFVLEPLREGGKSIFNNTYSYGTESPTVRPKCTKRHVMFNLNRQVEKKNLESCGR